MRTAIGAIIFFLGAAAFRSAVLNIPPGAPSAFVLGYLIPSAAIAALGVIISGWGKEANDAIDAKSPEEDGNPGGNISAYGVGAIFCVVFTYALGVTFAIPAASALFAFFLLKYADKKLKAKGASFGGLGTTYPGNTPYKGLLALEFGHFLWAVSGIFLYLSVASTSTEIQLNASTFIELGGFLAMVVFFLVKPNWLSILLLFAYHCYAIYGTALAALDLNESGLSGFSRATQDTLERAYTTHTLFHGMALFGLAWLSYALLTKDRSIVAILKSVVAKLTPEAASGKADTHERLTKLRELHGSGLISESDFEKKKAEILNDL